LMWNFANEGCYIISAVSKIYLDRCLNTVPWHSQELYFAKW